MYRKNKGVTQLAVFLGNVMQKRKRLFLAGITLATIVFLGSSVAYGVKLYTVENNLSPSDVDVQGRWQFVRLVDTNGEDIVHFNLLFEPASSNLIPLGIEIWHIGWTELDALRFSFDPQPATTIEAWLNVPEGGPWNPIHSYRRNRTLVFDIADLGFMGTGTARLDLLIQTLGNFDFKAYLTLHNVHSVLVETSYVGQFTLPLIADSLGEVSLSDPVRPY